MRNDFRAALEAQLGGLTEDAIALTRDMVRCDSQSPPSDTTEVLTVVRRVHGEIPGLEIIEHCRSEPIHNIGARLSGTRPGPKLILSGHLDTYPIGPTHGWSRDPLSGEVADGHLYGRGSRAVVAAAEDCFPNAVVANMRVGASDARLWRRAGHATIVVGLTPYNLGAPDEHLALAEIPDLIRIQAQAAMTYLAGNPQGAFPCGQK